MATRPDLGIEVLLSAIPSLPRPVLARLTAKMIDRMDELDGDVDLEDDTEDCCEALDDAIVSGPCAIYRPYWGERTRIGSDDDAEPDSRELHVLAPCGSLYVRLPRR